MNGDINSRSVLHFSIRLPVGQPEISGCSGRQKSAAGAFLMKESLREWQEVDQSCCGLLTAISSDDLTPPESSTAPSQAEPVSLLEQTHTTVAGCCWAATTLCLRLPKEIDRDAEAGQFPPALHSSSHWERQGSKSSLPGAARFSPGWNTTSTDSSYFICSASREGGITCTLWFQTGVGWGRGVI